MHDVIWAKKYLLQSLQICDRHKTHKKDVVGIVIFDLIIII